MNVDHLGDRLRFTTYSKRMQQDPAGIAEELRLSAAEQGIKFDTIVGRGSSGMLIVPVVARILRKKWFIIRKPEEVESSHDSSAKWLGDLGKRWIFLDDFCSSGATFRKVRDGVREAVAFATAPYQTFGPPQDDPKGRLGWYTYARPEFSTELVGYYQYESRDSDCQTLIPWDELARPGYGETYLDDAPCMIAEKAREEARAAEYESITVSDGSGNTIDVIGTTDENGDIVLAPEPATEQPCCSMCVKLGENFKAEIDRELAREADDVDTPEIRAWGDTSLIGQRYATYAQPVTKSDMIVVRSI